MQSKKQRRLVHEAALASMFIVWAGLLCSCRAGTVEDALGGEAEGSAQAADELFIKGSGSEETVLFVRDEKYLNAGKGYTLWTLKAVHDASVFEPVEVLVQKHSGDSKAGY